VIHIVGRTVIARAWSMRLPMKIENAHRYVEMIRSARTCRGIRAKRTASGSRR
jgi:hypothetical protein